MPKFTPKIPVVTATPVVEVEGLPAGRHRFQLVVEDESGNRSQPSLGEVTVVVRPPITVRPRVGAIDLPNILRRP